MTKKKKEKADIEDIVKDQEETLVDQEEAISKEAVDSDSQTPVEEASEDDKGEGNEAQDLKAEVQNLNDRYLRLNAEFQNYRKRVEKEKTDIFKYGNEKLIIEMLPIMDNFERALSSFEEDHAEDKVLSGVKMIKKSLDDFFEKNGVKKIEAVNTPFDPDKHHAVMTEAVEGVEGETVVAVFQEGYTLGDKVIRPSMVKVSS
ncbi:nucleotide exchange factor GrpE [Fusibacter ferrireducens]|uniref:Protein GrpE n=1 Tax=Fusibacter ferrireducens TaxID=2785058 RepID=A0ABR9ZXN5_9FIRM|nr:nucleotide exchange factor GrpE [Fusibacter ferrireducens]MBF4694908.1 nucleotide exchange factor GrpE [Fusibacter ferrireducens]